MLTIDALDEALQHLNTGKKCHTVTMQTGVHGCTFHFMGGVVFDPAGTPRWSEWDMWDLIKHVRENCHVIAKEAAAEWIL